jgi:hypothetical protein
MNVSASPGSQRGPSNKGEEDQLFNSWIDVIGLPGADGIIVDELVASPDYYPYWISAIRRVRAAYPTKLQAVWLGGGDWSLEGGTDYAAKTSDFINELHSHTDYVIPELYLAQQDVIRRSTDSISLDFSGLSHVIERWCAKFGSNHILQRCVIGIGALQDHGFTAMRDSSGKLVSRTLNDAPDMSYSAENPQLKLNYGQFLAKQIDYCANHRLLSKALGVAIWSPNYITYDNLGYLNKRLKRYEVGGAKKTVLYIVPFNGKTFDSAKETSQVVSNGDGWCGWSWDGTTASYLAVNSSGQTVLYIVPFNGKTFDSAKETSQVVSDGDGWRGWSWDGTTASYLAVNSSGQTVLYIVPFNGKTFDSAKEISQVVSDGDGWRGWSWDGITVSYLATQEQ